MRGDNTCIPVVLLKRQRESVLIDAESTNFGAEGAGRHKAKADKRRWRRGSSWEPS